MSNLTSLWLYIFRLFSLIIIIRYFFRYISNSSVSGLGINYVLIIRYVTLKPIQLHTEDVFCIASSLIYSENQVLQ